MKTNVSVVRRLTLAALLAYLARLPAAAEVKPHALFSENAVLQQQMAVPVWGTAADGEPVTVEFQDQKLATTASNGQWQVVLKPLTAGGPFTLRISGTNSAVAFTNIAVGEVWLCSGQSNMASGLGDTENGAAELARANDPLLRILVVPIGRSEKVERDLAGPTLWRPIVGSYNANLCGAVPYYFARELCRARQVPVGILQCVWGGSLAEAWTPRNYLEADPTFKPIFARYPLMLKQYETALADYQKGEPELKKQYAEALAKAKAEGAQPPKPPAPPMDPAQNGKVQRDRPYGIFNGMLAPLQPYAIRGAAWYQGESSRDDVSHQAVLSTMIRAWRETWGQQVSSRSATDRNYALPGGSPSTGSGRDFPFLIVQLPGYSTYVSEPGESFWAELREAQLITSQKVPNTALAITVDLGDEKNLNNLHPPRKEPVGVRLGLAARALAYGEKIEYSGPIYESMDIKGDRAFLRFQHVGGGLVAGNGAPSTGSERALKGFAIAGSDKKFVNAQAEIRGAQVMVWSPLAAKPAAVRYGWATHPVGNLWNREGLPASPFRTDAADGPR